MHLLVAQQPLERFPASTLYVMSFSVHCSTRALSMFAAVVCLAGDSSAFLVGL